MKKELSERPTKDLTTTESILSDKQNQILQFFKEHGPITLESAYEKMHMNKKTAGYHIKKLEDFGFLETVHTHDGRFKPRILSNMGQEILEKQSRKNILFYPDIAPEPTPDFINREIEQEEMMESIKRKQNFIVVQGIAGIGKTELLAKIRSNLKNKYITYWKKISSLDDYNSLVRNLAGFLNESGDYTLYHYLENGGDDYNSIVNYIMDSLNSRQYILFFDDYHNINDNKIDELFSKLKDNLKNSTVILSTRVTPIFVRGIDKIQNKILDEVLEGFDLNTTNKYFLKKGITLSSEQLNKINEKMGGHPLSLLLFFSRLTKNIDIEDYIEDIPKGDIERFLWREVFDRLTKEEQELLGILSVFRTPIKSDTLSQITEGKNIKENLLILEEKLLVKRNKNYYYLHDLMKEFCYSLMDIPKRKRIHKLIGEYYSSQEKNHENLIEASHHLIKNYGIINDDIIDYFLSTPVDTYLFFIINEILKHNKINSNKIFCLFDKFIESKNVQIVTAFILSYCYYFNEMHNLNKEESFNVYHKILQSYKDIGVFDAVSLSVKEIADKHPKESLQIWKKVVNMDIQLARVIAIYIIDTNLKNEDYINFLKDILCQIPDEYFKQKITEVFEKWGLTGYQQVSIADHLNKIRHLSINSSIIYMEQNYKIMNPYFAIQILSELFKFDKPKIIELIKNLVEYHKESYNWMLFQASDILSNSLGRDDLNHLNIFIKKENNKYVLLVGIRALDLLSNTFESELLLEYLNPLLNHENITIRKIANLTKKVILNKNHWDQRIRKDFHSFFRFLNVCIKPQSIVSMLKTEFRPTAPFVISVWTWGTIKTIENYDTNELLDVCESVLESNNPVMLDATKWAMDKLQTEPKLFTDFLYRIGYKDKKISYKRVSIPLIIMMGRLVPETVDLYLKQIIKDDDDAILSLLENLRLYTNQKDYNKKELLNYLINHNNNNISGFADFLLNGINK